jgi:hypothetical protein
MPRMWCSGEGGRRCAKPDLVAPGSPGRRVSACRYTGSGVRSLFSLGADTVHLVVGHKSLNTGCCRRRRARVSVAETNFAEPSPALVKAFI